VKGIAYAKAVSMFWVAAAAGAWLIKGRTGRERGTEQEALDSETRTERIRARFPDSAGDVSQSPPVAAVREGQPTEPSPNLRLLLVDDHAGMMEALSAFFVRADGFQVCGQAATLAAASQLAHATQPDAIVLDQHLPDGLGTDAVPMLRELCPQTRLVLHSAAADVHQLARRAGVDGWVAKGGTLLALANELRLVCHRPRHPA
jgi:CheY-like chemotaxis protein